MHLLRVCELNSTRRAFIVSLFKVDGSVGDVKMKLQAMKPPDMNRKTFLR